MERVKIHYEDITLDCKDGLHGPLFFFEKNKEHKHLEKGKICINAACLECGKVANYIIDKEYSKTMCVYANGEYLKGPATSRVKTFYDTSNRYYELLEEAYDTTEEIVEVLNNEKKLVK